MEQVLTDLKRLEMAVKEAHAAMMNAHEQCTLAMAELEKLKAENQAEMEALARIYK